MMVTSRADEELIEAVSFPVVQDRCAFREVARRHGDFAIVGAACGVELDASGIIARAAVALFGVGRVPYRATAAERLLIGAAEVDAAEVGRAAAERATQAAWSRVASGVST